MKHNYKEYSKMQERIGQAISDNIEAKGLHGFIYETRSVNWGDSTVFESGGKQFSIKMKSHSVDVTDILETSNDWTDKSDMIAAKIIDEIDSQISDVIANSNISTNLLMFKRCVKIVIENNPIITGSYEAHMRFGVELIFD